MGGVASDDIGPRGVGTGVTRSEHGTKDGFSTTGGNTASSRIGCIEKGLGHHADSFTLQAGNGGEAVGVQRIGVSHAGVHVGKELRMLGRWVEIHSAAELAPTKGG